MLAAVTHASANPKQAMSACHGNACIGQLLESFDQRLDDQCIPLYECQATVATEVPSEAASGSSNSASATPSETSSVMGTQEMPVDDMIDEESSDEEFDPTTPSKSARRRMRRRRQREALKAIAQDSFLDYVVATRPRSTVTLADLALDLGPSGTPVGWTSNVALGGGMLTPSFTSPAAREGRGTLSSGVSAAPETPAPNQLASPTGYDWTAVITSPSRGKIGEQGLLSTSPATVCDDSARTPPMKSTADDVFGLRTPPSTVLGVPQHGCTTEVLHTLCKMSPSAHRSGNGSSCPCSPTSGSVAKTDASSRVPPRNRMMGSGLMAAPQLQSGSATSVAHLQPAQSGSGQIWSSPVMQAFPPSPCGMATMSSPSSPAVNNHAADTLQMLFGTNLAPSSKGLAAQLQAAAPEVYED